MKTIAQWLAEQPEEWSTPLLQRCDGEGCDDKVASLSAAIASAFDWASTPEHFCYWQDVICYLNTDAGTLSNFHRDPPCDTGVPVDPAVTRHLQGESN